MPANDNANGSAYASKISSRRKTKEETGFDAEYRKLCEGLAKKGGRISESEERRLDKFHNIDKDDYLKREELFLEIKE